MQFFIPSRFFYTCIRFIHLQLFLLLIALPFLISWGIPLSYVTPLGNIIFGPFISAFLMVSSLIFFTTIMHMPNTFLIMILEHISSYWYVLLQWHPTSWYITIGTLKWWILMCIPFCAFIFLYQCIHYSPIKGIGIHSFYAFLLIYALKLLSYQPYVIAFIPQEPNNHHTILVLHDHGTTLVLDPGIIAHIASATNWTRYTLIPEIIKKTGSNTIDVFISLKPSIRLYDALTVCTQKIVLNTVYLSSHKKTCKLLTNIHASIQKYGGSLQYLPHTSPYILNLPTAQLTCTRIHNYHQIIFKTPTETWYITPYTTQRKNN